MHRNEYIEAVAKCGAIWNLDVWWGPKPMKSIFHMKNNPFYVVTQISASGLLGLPNFALPTSLSAYILPSNNLPNPMCSTHIGNADRPAMIVTASFDWHGEFDEHFCRSGASSRQSALDVMSNVWRVQCSLVFPRYPALHTLSKEGKFTAVTRNRVWSLYYENVDTHSAALERTRPRFANVSVYDLHSSTTTCRERRLADSPLQCVLKYELSFP